MAPHDLLFFLGAGASVPPPSRLPAFVRLTDSVLRGLDWQPGSSSQGKPVRWTHRGYPDIAPPWRSGMPPEVVFRVLDQLKINFATPVEQLMTQVEPNAAHKAAAALLAEGGVVWTTNIDLGVELAWRQHPGTMTVAPPTALGGLVRLDEGCEERDFSESAPGTLVKFHGSADVPGSLAFTDQALLTPLPESQVAHLSQLASGKRMVFFGYRGLDADLHELLQKAMAQAAEVTWLVVDPEVPLSVRTLFPDTLIRFVPERLSQDVPSNTSACAREFLDLAERHGLLSALPPSERALLGEPPDRHGGWRLPDFAFRPSQLVHAQLVERFGDPARHEDAFRAAWRADLAKPSMAWVRAWPQYLLWKLKRSFYGEGEVARVVLASALVLRHPAAQRVSNLPGMRSLRDVVLDKGFALLLRRERSGDLLDLTEFASRVRRTRRGSSLPTDLYYHGHALRHAGILFAARNAQQEAERGLAGGECNFPDPERLAGAILEQGILDLYQGRFHDALRRGDDLQDVRGRYAIQRWASWGHWLAGLAHLGLADVDPADKHLDIAAAGFGRASDVKRLADVRAAQLLGHRVALALALEHDEPPPSEQGALSIRQRQELWLIRSDFALAEGDYERSTRLLEPVLRQPANAMAGLWARLLQCELTRLRGRSHGDEFAELAREAEERGIAWLRLLAEAGRVRSGTLSLDAWRALASSTQGTDIDTLEKLCVGPRPVFWSLT